MTRLPIRLWCLILTSVAIGARALIATAQSTPTPYKMIDGHFAATVTLLADGEVLIAGGGDAHASAVDIAEIYDPRTDSFRPAGNGLMTTPRTDHAASLLMDGRVLIAGGMNRMGKPLSSAELFDPKTGKFVLTAEMAEARYLATATLLPDGRVLIAGGASTAEGSGGPDQERREVESLDTAELYNPMTGTFAPAGKAERVFDLTSGKFLMHASMNAARREQTATLLTSGPLKGQVLLVGGLGAKGKPIAAAELYNPAINAFTPTGAMMVERAYQTATELRDGRVLIAGGTDATNQSLATAELYDQATGKFALTAAPMEHARYQQTATLLNDGRVLLAGGANNAGVLSYAEIFDPGSGRFLPAALMKDYRMAAGGVLLHNGCVFIAGGYNTRPSFSPGAAMGLGIAAVPFRVLDTAEIYNPANGQFVDTRDLGRAAG